MWYVTIASPPNRINPISANGNQELIVWVYDPETADASELNRTAIRPSQSSQKLSKLFWNLGQEPVVHTHLKKDKYYSQQHPRIGLWTVDVPAESEDIIITIHGKAIAFQECFVLDTPFIIPRPKQSFPSKKNDTSLCAPKNSDMTITWSACFPTTAVLLTDFGTFYTSDGFKTYDEIKVPSDALTQGLNNNVTDVALTDNGILFLINGLPEKKISGICSRYWCPLVYPVRNGSQLSTLGAWTSNEIYLLYGEIFHKMTDTTNLVKILHFPKDAVLSIEIVSYDSIPSEITLLLICNGCSSSKLFYLAFYSEDRQFWGLREFHLPVTENSVTKMVYLNSALSCGVLWNNESIYYTYRNNTTNGFFQIYGSNLSLSEMSNGSTIHQIIPDYLGNVMIKMKNNYLFYTKSELRGLVQLPDWIDETKKMVLYLNPSASVYTLLIDGSNIYRQTYPLELEIFSSTLMSEFSCSIIAFLHNMHFSIYYLDMGDELTFWSQIVFEENVDIGTYLEVYRPELLLLRGSSKYEIARRVCTKNETFTFYHYNDYTLESNYTKALELTSGVMSVEMQPSVFEASCKLNCKVAHFFVGCPPGRHIVVERPPEVACRRHDFTTYRIPGKFLWRQTVEDKIAYYDWDKYGCLMELHYEQYFQPVISLYDGDKYVRRVEANFILWEMKGRSDYGYTSSMKEEGCLHKAQSWPMMLNASKNSTLDEIWGPQNYRSCFVFDENSTEEGLYEQYQILNMTSTNSIAWSPSHSGIYVFRVRIVDPNYSFCDLKAFFAVRTYGIIQRSDISSVTLYSFFIICIFVAFLILSYFRYTEIFQDLKHADEKKASPDEQEN
ncbi:cation channel sperm-associated protein subunit epsilon [Nothoprocta perdicaria]|uniref:cation channel sperm-associated protein subunit epsilon n=1 Tax=Nothoprocta perdicaria TaxID=30464 RepID=UPI000E1BB536|nr:cation channel sperm-associated protein subunit epsilon [Nothoprocta perdicaria]